MWEAAETDGGTGLHPDSMPLELRGLRALSGLWCAAQLPETPIWELDAHYAA